MLLSHLNDNVFKNIEGFSIALFDKQMGPLSKDKFTKSEKKQIVNKLLTEELDFDTRKKKLFSATDRILYAQRNLKLMIFLTSGPFFLCFYLFKKSC